MVAVTRAARAPKVSILIPTQNCARFLWQTLESVLAQRFSDFEVIVADNASSDTSVELTREFSRLDSRLHLYVHNIALEPVENWNWCLREARGEYVKFMLPGDCFTQVDSLGRMVAALEAAPNTSLVATARLVTDDELQPVGLRDDFPVEGLYDGIRVISGCMQLNRNLIGELSAVLFRRDASTRGFDPSFRQAVDLEHWYHLLLQGDFVYLSEPLCAFRLIATHPAQIAREHRIGSAESLIVTVRYLECVSNPKQGGLTKFQRRRLLYRQLYYSQKNTPRSASILVAEAMVRSQLPRPWELAMMCLHRLTKPVENLRRFVRNPLFRSPDLTVSLALVNSMRARPAELARVLQPSARIVLPSATRKVEALAA